MFDEHEVVKAKRDLSVDVVKGSIGTIVMIYNSSNYEVEFFDEKGDHLALLTVNAIDLER